MKLQHDTIQELGKVFIRFGEAAVIGASASMFVGNFPIYNAIIGVVIGTVLVTFGILIHNKAR
jgi:uncharacterized YccA/Bax inhibitor family protein